MAERDEVNLPAVVAICSLALRQITVPEGSAEQIEFCRRLDDVVSALAIVRTRLQVAAVLSRAPIATSGIGTSPLASEAADRLRRAMINLLAVNIRAVTVIAQRDT
ncbi:hypothetical protein ASF98_08510 [Arthrobacter sp. Leaf337]|nr:hypothetical protein ASF98_08510 [Arthrobacter sp. Leaf337]